MKNIIYTFKTVFVIAALLAVAAGCVSNGSGSARFLTESKFEKQVVEGYLRLPTRPGPHPAVVMLHGCGGLELEVPGRFTWRALNRHADDFNDAGIATFIVDSYGPRGQTFDELMRTGCARGAKFSTRVDDLYGAIAYLDTLPEIDGNRIGAIGLSEGATAVLRALQTDQYRTRSNRLRASVALYPACPPTSPPYYAPSMILIGDKDDITYYGACENTLYLAELVKDGNQWSGDMPVVMPELKVYPGVYHSFDLPIPRLSKIPIGTVAPNQPATLDARARTIAFFKKHL